MLVGLGGNNGTTLMGSVIANREGVTWKTKEGVRAPNYWGSLTQASTCRVGSVNGKVTRAHRSRTLAHACMCARSTVRST